MDPAGPRKNALLTRRRILLGTAAAVGFGAAGATVQYFVRDTGPSEEVIDWLRANAWPLATVEPGQGHTDLQPFRAVIENARIVALGEATHGTREFFQLKHRLIEFCVTALGFNVIALETEYGSALAVNDYVLEGKGNAADALAAMGYWFWDTQEMLALIEWVRTWNLANGRKVKFYGFDMQGTWGDGSAAAAVRLLDYLARAAPELAAEAELALTPLVSAFHFPSLEGPLQVKIKTQVMQSLAAFDAERRQWIDRSSEREWHAARLCAITIRQTAEHAELKAAAGDNESRYKSYRDRCMAENVQALLQMEGASAKAILWAHNGHVQRTPYTPVQFFSGQRTFYRTQRPPLLYMGNVLDSTFGADYVAIGFAFNQGSFLADDERENNRTIRESTLPPASSGTLDEALARVRQPILALDLSAVTPQGAVGAWMATRLLQWEEGLSHHPDRLRAASRDPRADFSVLIFVETTSATRLNPFSEWLMRPLASGAGAAAPNKEPTNLALQSTDEILPGWRWFGNINLHRYTLTFAEGQAPSGGRAVRIARTKPSLPWGFRTLSQTFAASPWHGKRLTFRAAIRTETTTTGRGVLLYIQVMPKVGGGGAQRSMLVLGNLIHSIDWTQQSIAADVPADAETIQIAVCVVGETVGWLGDLAIEGV